MYCTEVLPKLTTLPLSTISTQKTLGDIATTLITKEMEKDCLRQKGGRN